MKQPLILFLLLLGTASAFHLDTTHGHLEGPKKEPDLWQDEGGSKDQGGDLAMTQETMQTEGEEAEGAEHQDTFEDEESNPDALDKDSTCPSEEDITHLQGTPGCKSCHYVLVRTPKTFYKAQSICRRCYHGNLASIHSYSFNFQIQSLARKINQFHIWIGSILKGWFFWKKFRWTDGSCWDFGYWAPGQPGNGGGHCVTLCTTGPGLIPLSVSHEAQHVIEPEAERDLQSHPLIIHKSFHLRLEYSCARKHVAKFSFE